MTALRKHSPPDFQDALRIVEYINALQEHDLSNLGVWQELADLSSRTAFEAIDADPSSVVVDGDGKFEALASVYVTLVYGPTSEEETLSDEYLATFQGVATEAGIKIDSASIDVSSFYE